MFSVLTKVGILQWVSICYDGCSRGNIYNTLEDELRWCPRCKLWVHANCSQKLDLNADDIPEWLETNDQTYILHVWDNSVKPSRPTIDAIAALPIGRYPMDNKTPHSLEKVIVLAREVLTWVEEDQDQVDYDEFIEEADAHPDAKFVKQGVKREIEEALANRPVFHLCPKCRNFAI